jgi:hypothetical protein
MRMLGRLLARDNRAAMLAFGLLVWASPALAQQQGWQTYSNPRFAYSICFPANFHQVGQDPDNGDGRVYADETGVELRVWGEYNSLDDTLDSAAERRVGYLKQDGVRGIVANSGSDWFALVGLKGTSLVYVRSRLSHGRFVTLQVTHPAKAVDAWNPVVAKIVDCLQDIPEAGQ